LSYQKNARNDIGGNLGVGWLFLGGSRGLEVPQQAGLQKIHQSSTVPLRSARFPDAREHPSHTDLHHALVIVVLHIVRMRDDGPNLGELFEKHKSEIRFLDNNKE